MRQIIPSTGKIIITIFVNETKCIFEKKLKKPTPKMTPKVTPDSTPK